MKNNSTTEISVLHMASSLSPQSGGPARTITQLTDALSNISLIKVSLLSQTYKETSSIPSNSPLVNRCICSSNSKIALKFGLPIFNKLHQFPSFGAVNLLHSHGLWLPANHWPVIAARKLNIPLILHPRGMLEPWAINHHAFKKRLAMALFQKKDIKTAAVIMATSNDEYKNIRNLGFTNPIAVIPNGIIFNNDTIPLNTPSKKFFRTALFLSRIHPKKGLLNLINAWAKLQPAGWKLIIVGPDEGGHQTEVMRLVHDLELTENVIFIGEVDGIEKRNTYLNADLFVLPTFSENFGVVVAEALSYGVPVITTKGTPWQDLEAYNCGWWIDIGVEPLTLALHNAIALTDQQRREMGENGKQYVQRYNWQDIAQQTAHVYRWVLGQTEKPDFVYTD